MQRIHPDDRDRVQQTRDRASEAGADFDLGSRLLMAGWFGEVRPRLRSRVEDFG